MEVLRVLSGVPLGEGVDLDPEGDALLSAVLPGGELRADAVHLKEGGETSERGRWGFFFWGGLLSLRRTCTKTEVLFFMSHRNSAALSWEG